MDARARHSCGHGLTIAPLVFTLACASACASSAPFVADAPRGSAAGEPVASGHVRAPLDTLEPHDLARRFASGRDCELRARDMALSGALDRGFDLLRACAERRDFVDVRPLLRAPWIALLKRRGDDGVLMLAKVLARSPDTFVVDAGLLADRGIDLLPFSEADRAPSRYVGRFAMLRGTVEVRESRDRSDRVVMEQIQGRQFVSYYYDYSDWRRRPGLWVPSGRELTVGRVPSTCQNASTPQIMLVRIAELGAPSDDGEAPGTAVVGRGELIACFREGSTTSGAERYGER